MNVSCVVSGKSLFHEVTPIQTEDVRETLRQCGLNPTTLLCVILRMGLANTFPALSHFRHRRRQAVFVDHETLIWPIVKCYSD